jgi:hypothetical protein
MARRQNTGITSQITAAFDKAIRDYPLLVLHTAFILGVMLGRTAKGRVSPMDWAKDALRMSPRLMAASPFASSGTAVRRPANRLGGRAAKRPAMSGTRGGKRRRRRAERPLRAQPVRTERERAQAGA